MNSGWLSSKAWLALNKSRNISRHKTTNLLKIWFLFLVSNEDLMIIFWSFQDFSMAKYSSSVLNSTNLISQQFFQRAMQTKQFNQLVSLRYREIISIKGALSGFRKFLATENPLNMMKRSFLFHLKSSFRLSWHFSQVEKRLG